MLTQLGVNLVFGAYQAVENPPVHDIREFKPMLRSTLRHRRHRDRNKTVHDVLLDTVADLQSPFRS